MAKDEKPASGRAKTHPDQEFMTTIGAAWRFRDDDGYIARLESVRANWDGSFCLVWPKDCVGDEHEILKRSWT